MAEVYTFDVVPEDVAQFIGGAPFNTNTRPTYVETEAIIYRHAAVWCGFMIGMGMSPQTFSAEPTSAVYGMAQQFILNKTAAQVARARDRNAQELAQQYVDEAERIIKLVREFPQTAASARPTDPSAPNITYVAPITDPNLYRNYVYNGTVSQRSASTNRM